MRSRARRKIKEFDSFVFKNGRTKCVGLFFQPIDIPAPNKRCNAIQVKKNKKRNMYNDLKKENVPRRIFGKNRRGTKLPVIAHYKN
jgi:hypothetical protein